eukprot:2871890-Prymnesium_polylepis.1
MPGRVARHRRPAEARRVVPSESALGRLVKVEAEEEHLARRVPQHIDDALQAGPEVLLSEWQLDHTEERH